MISPANIPGNYSHGSNSRRWRLDISRGRHAQQLRMSPASFRGTPKTGSNRDNDAVIVGLVSWERFYDPIICRIDFGSVCRLCVRE
jgi:hypothetical protein